MIIIFSLSFSVLTLLVGRQDRRPACQMVDVGLGLLVVTISFDWSFVRLIAFAVTTSSVVLKSYKIQNPEWRQLVPAYPSGRGNWPLNKHPVVGFLGLIVGYNGFPMKPLGLLKWDSIYIYIYI